MATFVKLDPTQSLDPFQSVKKIPAEEFFTSGHRTCQGCESALVMKLMVKAAGPRTIVLGSTGCMYVANTTYYSTAWVVPWMHTQLGSSGSAALGTAAGLKVLMRKGKIKRQPVRDYLLKQGRFAHFTDDDIDYFQSKVDDMWTKWLIPGVIPFHQELEAEAPK